MNRNYSPMKVLQTEIDGILIVEPTVYADSRGYFFESFNAQEFERLTGKQIVFVQDNQSSSTYGVIRGLHFQKPPFAQAKLVRVLRGCILDVAVDIRTGSPTYGKYVAVELSAENKRQLFIPHGFAHGFNVLSQEGAEMFYKCDNFYNKDHEGGIQCDDPQLAIDWQVPHDKRVLSEKDKLYGAVENIINIFSYESR